MLKSIGFRVHNEKISKLINIIRERQKSGGSIPLFADEQTLKGLRKLKDTTLYIDYENGKIIEPLDSVIIKPKIFQGYVEWIDIVEKMMRLDFELFKKNEM